MTDADKKAIMDNVEWCAADNGYFRGGGFSSRFVTKAEVPCTMIRLNTFGSDQEGQDYRACATYGPLFKK